MMLKRTILTRAVNILAACVLAVGGSCFSAETAEEVPADLVMEKEEVHRWAVRVGVGFITSNDIGEVLIGDINIADGAAGGEVYSLSLSYLLHQFEWKVGDAVWHPQLELPVTIGVIDENERSPYFDYSAAGFLRWVDFPWNDYVTTSFGTGLGLSYTERIMAMDRQRHPEEDRSHWKFAWPIELTFSVPRWPRHELVIYNDHQSGGHLFDDGGVNNVGIGYRFEF